MKMLSLAKTSKSSLTAPIPLFATAETKEEAIIKKLNGIIPICTVATIP
jgi:hypothetical protein